MHLLEVIANAIQSILSSNGKGSVSVTVQSSAEVGAGGVGVGANVVYTPANEVAAVSLAIGRNVKSVGSVVTTVIAEASQPVQDLQQLQALVPIDQISPPSGGGNP